jgi:hypothetical protein
MYFLPKEQEAFGMLLQRGIDGGWPQASELRHILSRMHQAKLDDRRGKHIKISDAEHDALTDSLLESTISDFSWAPVSEELANVYPLERRIDRVPYRMVEELE